MNELEIVFEHRVGDHVVVAAGDEIRHLDRFGLRGVRGLRLAVQKAEGILVFKNSERKQREDAKAEQQREQRRQEHDGAAADRLFRLPSRFSSWPSC